MKIWTPSKNLGCLGFEFKRLYFDFFISPYFGMYIGWNRGITNSRRYYIDFSNLTFHKVR